MALDYFEQRVLPSTFTVDSIADDGEGSLRWAISEVNADATPSTIRFDLPGSGIRTIALATPLPTILHPVVIDGRSQPDYSGSPLVRLDGGALPSGQNGLTISAGDSTVAGMIVTGFRGAGIVLTAGGGNRIESSTIGPDPTSFTAQPNGQGIVILASSYNTLGGNASSAGNLISGNSGDGVKIAGTVLDTIGNQVLGNFIGVSRNGLQALGNGGDGVLLSGGRGTLIGGPSTGLGNVVSGNGMNGIELNSGATGTLIAGNTIGLAADGSQAVANLRDGVLLSNAPLNTIGGLSTLAANQISGNHGSGIRTRIDTTGMVVQGNQIGTDLSGLLHLGNLGDGLTIGTGSNLIGGLSQGAGNTIAFNGSGAVGSGVQLTGLVTGVSILSNSMHDNAGLGINFGDGPTPNHPPPHGPGPNNWQNYPYLTQAQGDGQSGQLTGVLVGAASQSYLIQVFWSDQPDPSGFGEGKTYLGSVSATADGTGLATFTLPALGGVQPGGFLSVTATDSSGNTSEFSKAVVVQPLADLKMTLSATPNPAAQGALITYTAVVSNPGFLTAHHVVFLGQLPPGVTLVSASASQGSAPVALGGMLTADLGSLAPGSSATVVVQVRPPVSFSGNLIFSAQASMDEADSHSGDNAAVATVRVGLAADLSLNLTAGPVSGHVGDLLQYDLKISNAGPSAASNVILTFPFAPIVSYVTASGTQGTGVLQADRLVVHLGSIAAGGQARITVVLRAAGVGTINTIASLATDAVDPTPADDYAALETTIRPQADLRLAMQAPAVAADGHNVVYGVTVTNAGPNDAEGVTIQDQLPLLTSYLAASVDGGAVSFANGIITAIVGRLASGASTTLWIVAVPQSAVGTSLINAARVSSAVDDPRDVDNSAWRSTPVRPVSDLAASMAPISPSSPRGQPVTFQVEVTNKGPATEPNAVVSIAIPGWGDFVSASSSQGGAPTVAGGLLSAPLGAVAPGATARLTFTLAPKAGVTGPFTASASVQGDDPDFNLDDNTSVATAAVAPSSDLSVAVRPPSGPVIERSIFSYTIVVTANGPDDASNVTIRAPLPAGAAFVSASSTQGPAPTLGSGVVVAAVGSLSAGSSASITIVVRPMAPTSALALSATAVQDEFDPTADNAASAAVVVQPAADLSVGLYSVQSQVNVGGYVTWVSSVSNAGPSAAKGVVLSLPLGNSWNYAGSTTTQGAVQNAFGQVRVDIGTLAPGGVATVVLFLSPTTAGVVGLTAALDATSIDPNAFDNQAASNIAVQESPGALVFSQPSFSVPEDAGSATIAVYRTLGARGTVTVPYLTWGGNATPGVDYQAVSGTLTFGPGETVKTIIIPVLANPHDNHDEGFGLYLGTPTGGATLGGLHAVPVTIHDLDPDFTPPQVEWVRLDGDANWISSVTIGFSEPLNPGSAYNGAGYGLLDLGGSSVFGAGDNSWVAFSSPSYDAASNTVTITPTQALPAGRFHAIWIRSIGPTAITDLAGNPLGGGVDYIGVFGRGAALMYTDSTGNLVSFQVAGGGFLDIFRNTAGDAQRVTLHGAVPGSTTLSGSVTRPYGRGSGVTNVGAIDGLGAFGQVRVTLRSPPFLVKNYPFALSTGKPIVGRPASTPRSLPVRQRPAPVRRRW